MLVRVLDRDDLSDFVGFLMERARVVGPVAGEGHTLFAPLSDPADLTLDYQVTTIPPGRLFLPPEEPLLEFDLHTQTFRSVLPDPEPTILFGVHPCDLHAIALMDEIMSEDPADVHYMARRYATTIIGWDCRRPCHPKTLCYDKGTLQVTSEYDVFGIAVDNIVLWRARTAAGEAVLLDAPGMRGASAHERSLQREADRERDANFTRRLRGDVVDLPEALRHHRNGDAAWVEDVGRRCTSCGNCTMVCPTCYCFDTQDRVRLDCGGGERVRMWDSCQFHEFSAVAGGEVFRDSPGARELHRILKKEVYLLERFGTSGCVGCGRCNRACPADISLIDIYNTVLEAAP